MATGTGTMKEKVMRAISLLGIFLVIAGVVIVHLIGIQRYGLIRPLGGAGSGSCLCGNWCDGSIVVVCSGCIPTTCPQTRMIGTGDTSYSSETHGKN